MITGLLGEGLSVHEAAVHGVYLHGLQEIMQSMIWALTA